MRIITGTARGRRLSAPQGNDTRPTSDMLKEAMFSVVQFEVAASSVLDLFAGSGQLGLEAISRGASHACLIDSSQDAADIIRKNIQATGFAEQTELFVRDVFSFVASCQKRFDIIFLDPPYNMGIPEKILPELRRLLSDGGTVICEHESSFNPLSEYNGLFLKKTYKHGKISFSTFIGEMIT